MIRSHDPHLRPLYLSTGFYDRAEFRPVGKQKASNLLRFRFAGLFLGN